MRFGSVGQSAIETVWRQNDLARGYDGTDPAQETINTAGSRPIYLTENWEQDEVVDGSQTPGPRLVVVGESQLDPVAAETWK